MIIFGKEYNLDQDFADDDHKSLLKNEDSDILFEYELVPEVTGDEALCELWLRWRWFYKYKPESVTSEQYIKVLGEIFDMGVKHGKKERISELVNTLQKELEEYSDE
ncbi:MAG: hypothetical protein ACRC2J_01835 [Microcoleaceae cyanobacterium]